MILATIRTQTRQQHERLEAQLELLGPDLTLPVYTGLLEQSARVYGPLERAVAAVLPGEWHGPLELAGRRKADLLAQDLAGLGGVPGAALSGAALPALPDEAAAWGALYVMEGATLGGQIICRVLGERLGLTPERGLRFYASYGAQVGPRWTSFCALLTERAGQDDPAFVRSAVQGAQATFACFERVLVPARLGAAVAVQG